MIAFSKENQSALKWVKNGEWCKNRYFIFSSMLLEVSANHFSEGKREGNINSAKKRKS